MILLRVIPTTKLYHNQCSLHHAQKKLLENKKYLANTWQTRGYLHLQNIVQGFGLNSVHGKSSWGVEKFGFKPSPIEHIKGGDLSQNLQIMKTLLNNTATKGLTDSIIMNSSLAFLTSGRTKNLEDGVEMAKKLLKDGTVKKWLDKVTAFFN